ncbi:lipase class 3 family protein [Pholiota molesta]|nr:lipase class 3 family protein [Pholiota molesta]
MFSKCAIFFAVLYALTAVNAAPALVELSERQSITALTTAQISAFRPFSHFASTAYCSPSTTINWSCGANCNANSDFIPTASGGDGSDIHFLFCQAHSGFANEQAKTAATILSAVQTTIRTHSATVVTISDILSWRPLQSHRLWLPRVGNQAFADYVDAHLALTHINNNTESFLIVIGEDTIPIVPGRFLGYHHPSGEVHIMDNGSWVSCPGQDNPSTECIVGDVPNILVGNESDHDGPYDGVKMSC